MDIFTVIPRKMISETDLDIVFTPPKLIRNELAIIRKVLLACA
jgi:hypothetical protein